MIVNRLISTRVTPLMVTLEKTCSEEQLEQHFRDVLLAMKATVDIAINNVPPQQLMEELDKLVEESYTRSFKHLDK